MKIIITERQADKLFGDKIVCKKCDHSWKIRKNDDHPFLCNICGWDHFQAKITPDRLFF